VFHGIDEQNEMHLGRRDLIIVVEVVIQSSQHLNKPHDIMRMTHLPEISAKSWYQNIPVSDTSDQGRLLMGGLGDGSPTISKMGGLPRKDYTESPFRA